MAKPPTLIVHINGRATTVDAGSVVSAAILAAGVPCRLSISGAPRSALCGMGICFECRAVVDGIPHCRTCQLVCRDGMTVGTQR
ncbi:(2Fe-2S)-binding protein [Edaphobacter dinghuensis]|uniref:(2Fe-2S)-binding protein n=1 Tax=Edaphobacter dinghuensis TaxID=1560005 RepID=UPI00166F49CE|nr:(2Fe-2S)-binding protein [Edaphobacter dinghuensis]